MVELLEPEEQEIVTIILYVSASLSIIGSLFIIFTYCIFKDVQTLGTKLIFFLSLSDVFTSISWLPWNYNEEMCIAQAAVMQFFETASFFWTLIICFSLFQAFYLERLEEETARLVPLYHVICWGYPLFSVIMCLAKNKFGPAGTWCWISDPQDPFRLFVYGPIAVIMLIIICNFFAICVKMNYLQNAMKRNLTRRLTLYLLAFIVSQLPALANRIQNVLYPNDPLLILYILQAVFQPSQGFFNSLVYGLSENLFVDKYKAKLNEIPMPVCCKRKRKTRNRNGEIDEDVPIFDYDYYSGEE